MKEIVITALVSLLLFVVLLITISKCSPPATVNESSDDKGKSASYGVGLIVVDGCEYVVYRVSYGVSIVHHGNCHNPSHKTNIK